VYAEKRQKDTQDLDVFQVFFYHGEHRGSGGHGENQKGLFTTKAQRHKGKLEQWK
jgi:hypothetical protein